MKYGMSGNTLEKCILDINCCVINRVIFCQICVSKLSLFSFMKTNIFIQKKNQLQLQRITIRFGKFGFCMKERKKKSIKQWGEGGGRNISRQ